MLGVSLAVAKAAASALELPLYKYLHDHVIKKKISVDMKLPVPMSNVVNAGKHGGGKLELQEFMIVPVGASSMRERVRWISEVYHVLGKFLVKKYGPVMKNVGFEGGYAGPIDKIEDVMEALLHSIEEAGYDYKTEFKLALDAAASEFYKDDHYVLEHVKRSREELLDLYVELVKKYPIISLEDPFAENDWEGFVQITRKLGKKIQVVGDDLLVTNLKFINKAIELGACNALLLKVNQIGTLTESISAAATCYSNEYKVIVSHRSGETEDTTIADLSVALGTGQIKTGAPCRTDRTAKYNQLIRIAEELEEV